MWRTRRNLNPHTRPTLNDSRRRVNHFVTPDLTYWAEGAMLSTAEAIRHYG